MAAFLSGNSFTREGNYFFIFVGIVFLMGGLRGVATRKGWTRSKGGHITHYSGKEAVVGGVIGILVGVALIAFGGEGIN